MKKHCSMTGCSRRPRPIAQHNCIRAFAGNMIGWVVFCLAENSLKHYCLRGFAPKGCEQCVQLHTQLISQQVAYYKVSKHGNLSWISLFTMPNLCFR